ncbi:cytochrome P450 [Anabaena sphaerica FACHB-251]|uniref:Cytochrome P450 n=1 Tax=Anabaena sphaerica FACHB-251 TaxID=2692883 RepID=A0A926ZZY7_9NOST|nr:cytochrome P450 [Anabaena sphaerica]MBD2292941.1 cytochrome P450 [Anabaena sphaerica FACHB-251]
MVTVSPTNKTANYPPGPKSHPLLGILPDYAADPIGFMSRSAKDYGDIVLWKGPAFSVYQLNHPDYIEEVLVKKNSQFKKHQTFQILQRIWGNGLLVSEGEFWQRQRRLMQPAFHRERIFSYGEVMVDYTKRMLKNWHEGESRDIHEDMMHLTLEVVAKTLFGTELIAEVKQVEKAMQVSIEYFETRNSNMLLYFLPDWVPIPLNLRYQKAVQQFDNLIYRIIQQKRESAEDAGDLLSMLLHIQDEDGTSMSDKQIRDELITLLIAGHETTALALSWTWYLLSQHPDIEQKLQTELQTVLAGRTPTFADLPKLIYTERVITEVMRLYPPVWAMSRQVVEDCEVAGYPLRAGDGIVMSQWVMHRDPRYFDQPEIFNPDRWENDLAKKLPTFAYFPFAGGPRICIGQSFAKMEAVLILATIAQNFQLTLVPNQEIVPWPAFTLRPKYGVKMLINHR